MNKQQFFSLVNDVCDWNCAGNDEKVCAPLIKYLSKQSDEEIFAFEDIMSELLYTLDTKKNFKNAEKADRMLSDDTFLYSRCCALTNGENYYNDVLLGKNEEVWTMEFEALLYIASFAWAKKHKKNDSDFPHFSTLSYETGSNKNGWK